MSIYPVVYVTHMKINTSIYLLNFNNNNSRTNTPKMTFLCTERGWVRVPLAVEVFGGLGKTRHKKLSQGLPRGIYRNSPYIGCHLAF